MDKDLIKKRVIKTLLFTLAIAIILWAFYSNFQYNLDQGLDAYSGATRID